MRKAISFSIIIFLLLLVYQVGINHIKKEHNVSYNVENEVGSFKIEESYSYNNSDSYMIRITDANKNSFLFNVNNNFNKQREIVKDIITYNEGGVYCLSLEMLNNEHDTEPLCKIDNQIYTYSYVMKEHNIDSFLEKLTNFDYKKYKGETTVREDSGINVNRDYLEERELIVIYDYKRVVLHKQYNSDYFVFATSDNIKNTIGIRVGKYYLIPKLTESPTINTIIKYDLETDLKREMTAPKISKMSYIMGVHDDKLYVFDKSEMKQYEIDPYDDEINLVSSDTESILYKDGKETKISNYELANENIYFTEDTSAYSSIQYDEIYLGPNYAVYRKGDKFYKVYDGYLNDSIVIFDADDVREVIVREENIYYIKGDTIYRHNKYGDTPLVFKNEFKYNSENIYDVYFID